MFVLQSYSWAVAFCVITMVAAFWGVFIWKEFRAAPAGTSKLIAAMFGCFLVGLALIILARMS